MFLHADSLLQLAQALIWAAGKPQNGNTFPDDEDNAILATQA